MIVNLVNIFQCQYKKNKGKIYRYDFIKFSNKIKFLWSQYKNENNKNLLKYNNISFFNNLYVFIYYELAIYFLYI